MEAIFDSLGHIVYNIKGHKGYMIKWKLISPFCKKWSRNREPDIERVNEMVEYYNNGGYIPRIIHLAEIKNEGIVCYDGNHRKEVFNICNDDNFMCIVDIMFNSTQNEVYNVFNSINKSVQLPAIYIEDDGDENIKYEIIELVKKYEIRYKPFLSTSTRCLAPQFNRDVFTDNIYDIYKSFSKLITIKNIENILDMLNEEYSQGNICRPHSSYKKSVVDKCRKYNMWLFIERIIPIEHIEQIINK